MIKKKEIAVALLGLSASGKTTFYTKINHDAKVPNTPTPTYNHGNFNFSGKKISFWDCGGGLDAQRNCWDNALAQAQGIIWMVDLSDSNNFSASYDALQGVVSRLHEQLPILILGNKSDLEKGDAAQFKQKFSTFENSHIEIISATAGKNINEAFKWLLDEIKATKKRKKAAADDLKQLQEENQRVTSGEYRRKHDRDD